MTEWQPIKTAPKDGTGVLIYAPQCGGVVGEAWFCTGEGRENEGWWWSGFYPGNDGDRSFKDVGFDPTHWMPLPSPPKTEDAT